MLIPFELKSPERILPARQGTFILDFSKVSNFSMIGANALHPLMACEPLI
jgi:hypothetical protein